jgi:hypothetical protein
LFGFSERLNPGWFLDRLNPLEGLAPMSLTQRVERPRHGLETSKDAQPRLDIDSATIWKHERASMPQGKTRLPVRARKNLDHPGPNLDALFAQA